MAKQAAGTAMVLLLAFGTALISLAAASQQELGRTARRSLLQSSCDALASELSSSGPDYYTAQINYAARVAGDPSVQNCIDLACGWLNLLKPALGTLPASPETADSAISDCTSTIVEWMRKSGISQAQVLTISSGFDTCSNQGYASDPAFKSQMQAYCGELVNFLADVPSGGLPSSNPSAPLPSNPSSGGGPSSNPSINPSAPLPSLGPRSALNNPNLTPQKAAASLATCGRVQLLVAALTLVAVWLLH